MVSSARSLRPAVFLDRDGVIVIPHFQNGRSFAPRRLEDFRIYPDAVASLDRLKQRGFLLAVVTNQPDVGQGMILQSEVDAMHEVLRRELPIDMLKVCFHRQDENCDCRKPKPGMIVAATSRRAMLPAAPPSLSISAMMKLRPMLPIISCARSGRPLTSS